VEHTDTRDIPARPLEFITIWVILCLSRKEAQPMLRYADLLTHTTDVLDLTSLTVEEFQALVPPLRRPSWGTWPTGPCTGGAGRRDAIRPIRIVPCRPRKIACCSCWSTSSRILRNCCMGACSACANPRPRSGFMSYCPCCATRCGP
jgi:hypothetical protein